MAITIVEQKENELTIKLGNGELLILERIRKGWKFKDKESVLRFALAVLAKAIAGGKKIFIEENGNKVALNPTDNLLEQETQSNDPSKQPQEE